MYRWGIGKLIIKGRHVVFCINFLRPCQKKKKKEEAHTQTHRANPDSFTFRYSACSGDQFWCAKYPFVINLTHVKW